MQSGTDGSIMEERTAEVRPSMDEQMALTMSVMARVPQR